MIDEIKRRLDRADGGNARRWTALDHDHLDAERSRGRDLAIGGAAAGILGDDDVDLFVLEQLPFAVLIEGTAGQNVTAVANGKRRLDRIDAADEIAVLGRRRKAPGFLSADGEENAARRGAERRHGGIDAFHAGPSVTLDSLPSRPAQRKDRHPRCFSGNRRILGNPVGERMGRIHEQVDAFLSQIIDQALDTAEAADPGRQGQGPRIRRAAGKRNRRVDITARCDSFRQRAGLGRAAENQDTVLAHG